MHKTLKKQITGRDLGKRRDSKWLVDQMREVKGGVRQGQWPKMLGKRPRTKNMVYQQQTPSQGNQPVRPGTPT